MDGLSSGAILGVLTAVVALFREREKRLSAKLELERKGWEATMERLHQFELREDARESRLDSLMVKCAQLEIRYEKLLEENGVLRTQFAASEKRLAALNVEYQELYNQVRSGAMPAPVKSRRVIPQ